MSKLAVPVAFIFSRDALDTYARLTVHPAEAAPRVRVISLATLSALPYEASHIDINVFVRAFYDLALGCRGDALVPRRRTASSTIFAPPASMRGKTCCGRRPQRT